MAKHLSRPFVAPNDKSRLENILESCGIPEEQRIKLLTAIRAEKENLATIAFGGLPPHAPELEEAILSTILSSSHDHRNSPKGPGPVLHTIRTYLPKPAYFYLEANQTIYRTILAMAAEQLQIDELTVVQYMRQNKTLAAVGRCRPHQRTQPESRFHRPHRNVEPIHLRALSGARTDPHLCGQHQKPV